MVRSELVSFLRDLGAYYQQKVQPIDKSIDIWLEKVQRVPAEALPWIMKKITDDFESWPRNIPSAIWAFYHAWLDAHPEKRAYIHDRKCDECDSSGTLSVLKKTERGTFVSYVFRCGKCGQSNLSGIPAARIGTLLMNGYVERPKNLEELAEFTTAREMARKIGKPITEPYEWDNVGDTHDRPGL